VVTSLAKAHQATGTLVEIVMPKYDCANYGCVALQWLIVAYQHSYASGRAAVEEPPLAAKLGRACLYGGVIAKVPRGGLACHAAACALICAGGALCRSGSLSSVVVLVQAH
jgi:hypothetical protein